MPTKSPENPFSFTVLDEIVRLYGASFTSWTLMVNTDEMERGLGKSSVQLIWERIGKSFLGDGDFDVK